jgi:sterol desaturase/sphingolipid hydroxylase (fatty acid hydroxylase superfamily)
VPELAFVYLGLCCLWPLCAVLEKRSFRAPDNERRLDLAFWLISPVFTGALTRGATFGSYAVLGWLAGRSLEPGFALFDAAARLRALPPAVELGFALLLADAIGYWSHRLRHLVWWRFHRIHHAPLHLTAASAARLHPFDEGADGLLIGLGLLVVGFDWRVFAWVGPITLLYTLVSHVDSRTTFGPFARVLVSPAFHRLHHARRYAQPGVNFSGMFPIWDWLFGTAHWPGREAPEPFGIDQPLPETLRAQLLDPLLGRRAQNEDPEA